MRAPDDSRRGRRKAAPKDTAPQALVTEVARARLRREAAQAGAAQPPLPEVPRATRQPWSRSPRRPTGAAPTVELIHSLARRERTRQQ